jgi:hypothetical protein
MSPEPKAWHENHSGDDQMAELKHSKTVAEICRKLEAEQAIKQAKRDRLAKILNDADLWKLVSAVLAIVIVSYILSSMGLGGGVGW